MSETVQQATAASIEAAVFFSASLAQRAASLRHPDRSQA